VEIQIRDEALNEFGRGLAEALPGEWVFQEDEHGNIARLCGPGGAILLLDGRKPLGKVTVSTKAYMYVPEHLKRHVSILNLPSASASLSPGRSCASLARDVARKILPTAVELNAEVTQRATAARTHLQTEDALCARLATIANPYVDKQYNVAVDAGDCSVSMTLRVTGGSVNIDYGLLDADTAVAMVEWLNQRRTDRA